MARRAAGPRSTPSCSRVQGLASATLGLAIGWLVAWLCLPAPALGQAPEPAPAAPEVAPAPEPVLSPSPPGMAPIPLATPQPVAEVTEDDETEPPAGGMVIKYLLERVEVRGNARVSKGLIRSFVPLSTGHAFAVDDPEIEALRYRLLGTGWFDRVDLHLERGQDRGWVLLVIDVEERRTLVFQQLAAGVGWSVEGAKGKSSGDPTDRKPEPYLGLALAETNLFGTGNTLAGTLLVSPDQQGFSLGFMSPVVRASRWSLRTRGAFVNGQEYFGGDLSKDVRVAVQCPANEADSDCEINPPAAVVDYWRASLGLGTAKDVGSFTRLSIDWTGDFVRVPPSGMPVAASQVRGRGGEAGREPIDFAIERDNSYVSMLTLGFTYDKRDSAVLPSRGTLAGFSGDLASRLIGSDYEYVRVQMSAAHWLPLPWGHHTLRLGVFGGAVFGYAPFFYKFFVSDLTDLQPSRILGLNLDHRPAPNLFGLIQCWDAFNDSCGTAIAQMRHEEFAARVDAEYTWPLARGRKKFLKNADAFALIGLYALADPNDLRLGMPGYEGIAKLPVDLTLDLGVRLDTQAGVFQIGLAQVAWLGVQ